MDEIRRAALRVPQSASGSLRTDEDGLACRPDQCADITVPTLSRSRIASCAIGLFEAAR